MSDRTNVQLVTLLAQEQEVDALVSQYDETLEDTVQDSVFVTRYFSEVNHGALSFSGAMIKAGMPYEMHWEEGIEYCAGVTYVFFDEFGEIQQKTIYDSDSKIDVNQLMALVDTPKELVDYIKGVHKKIQCTGIEEIHLEYAKRYLLRKLISA